MVARRLSFTRKDINIRLFSTSVILRSIEEKVVRSTLQWPITSFSSKQFQLLENIAEVLFCLDSELLVIALLRHSLTLIKDTLIHENQMKRKQTNAFSVSKEAFLHVL